MGESNGGSPSPYDLLTAAGVILSGAALVIVSPVVKVLGVLLAFIALIVIVATHRREFGMAIRTGKPDWRLIAVASIALISFLALLSVLPSLFGSPTSTPLPGPTRVSAVPPARQPTEDDFAIVAVSPQTIAPGGAFTLLLKDLHSPIRPTQCKALPPTNLWPFLSSDWSACDDVTLQSNGQPIPRSADGRAQTVEATSFSPRIVVRFGPGKPDLVVAELANGGSLSITNLVPLKTGPKSRLILSLSRPFRADIRLTTGPMPPGFTCEWSDELDAVWNVARSRLSPNGCDYQITLINGPLTQRSLEDRKAVGQLASRLIDAFGFSLSLVVKADGEVYGKSIVKGQLRP